MSIALIGATGRTGRLVAEKLHRAGISFRALLRDEAQRAHFEGLGATVAMVDLTQDFGAALAGARTVIFTAGSAETEGAAQEAQIDRDAIIKAVDYAKQHGADRFIVISTLLAYAPERAPDALRHYAQMKRASDDYLIGSGLDYLVLRPGTLTMEPGTGTIEVVIDAQSARAPVARADVADVVLEALKVGVVNTIFGFAGGSESIDDALAALR
ncbi:nucleoside-diphosphate-sugar epimerase [Paraburkholderia sp. BL27I4N3]|uniref:SDR family oxidoreductase n=1 Tax=Paraburkholderia sp. BL27I4N3 TaxID=1938805 RepID=UPI000E26FA34|nr:SDR family oxidoreductase [Paraburkholderia sp. BL27I4N3]REE21728.1 nucleoside-diphosphate-sugar epimerase [Paraburkholderia sp. BL27I4N3]RKR38860.1 nucleoside-diphosphate-sugar epimerase [Paraburkholderia sp. BL17N1]